MQQQADPAAAMEAELAELGRGLSALSFGEAQRTGEGEPESARVLLVGREPPLGEASAKRRGGGKRKDAGRVVLPWRAFTALMYAVRKGEHTLAVCVSPEGFDVFALETDAPGGAGPAELFDSHAHQIVGQGKTLAGALELAEQYAQRWLERDTIPAPRCECGEIVGHP